MNNHVLFTFFSIHEDEVDYRKVVFNINWMKNPAKPVAPEIVRVIIFSHNTLPATQTMYNFAYYAVITDSA